MSSVAGPTANLLDDFYLKESKSSSELAMILCRENKPISYSWAEVSTQIKKLASHIKSLKLKDNHPI